MRAHVCACVREGKVSSVCIHMCMNVYVCACVAAVLTFTLYLREHGLVHLVVPVSPVADQVNHHVFVELLPPLGRYLAHMHHGLRLVSIHMEYGGRDNLDRERGRGFSNLKGLSEKRTISLQRTLQNMISYSNNTSLQRTKWQLVLYSEVPL